jgi:hypothetical protein
VRKDLKVADVWPLYLAARKPRWGDRHYQDHVNLAAKGGQSKKRGKGETVAGPLASLMGLRLSELTSENVAAWLENEAAARPTNAAQSFRKLRAFICVRDFPQTPALNRPPRRLREIEEKGKP